MLGGPFTARVCDLLSARFDRSTAIGAQVLDWSGDLFADALMLRLTGGLNAMVRNGDLPKLATHYPPHVTEDDALGEALAAALSDNRLLPWLNSAPQTNEVARSGVLMPGLLTIAAETGLPLALFELGASAGLNLRLDHYHYVLGASEFGPRDAPVSLCPAWEGPLPPQVAVAIASRRGVDLSPIDVRDPAARARLLAYVWPEQEERIARLEAALAAAASDPPPLDRGDAGAWVKANIEPVEGRVVVVMHSIAYQYFPSATQAQIAAHLETIGAQTTASAPLAWLRYESDVSDVGAPPTLRLRLWPNGEDRLLAHAHPHGAVIRWLG